jgi:hypothetical protein
MLRLPSARLLLGLTLIAFGAPAAAQDLAGKVATILTQADAAPIERAFEFGLQLLDTTDEERTDPLRDAIVQAAKSIGDHGRIAAAVGLQNLKSDSTYGKDILDVLQPVAKTDKHAARAAASNQVRDCAVQWWFRHASGRAPTEADACALAAMRGALTATDRHFEAMLVALVSADDFVTRAAAN